VGAAAAAAGRITGPYGAYGEQNTRCYTRVTMSYLERVSDPADLQQFSERELRLLAGEIRETILACVSEVGGHLGASLGTVELTLALHSVLRSPHDKIVWDVGHQCYAHKLLTGRRDAFGTIRQYGGLCGFPSRAESEHDIVGTGHASTSIGYGLGLVEASRLARESRETVVCVIGDGALTGGAAFEALNQAGQLRSPLVVIVNDNQMSIQPNVGALQLYLNRIRLDPTLTRLREDIERGVSRIPVIGAEAYRRGKDMKESMKALLVPGMLFEELGFAYIGVVDGHDLHALRASIRQAIDTRRPVVVHVKTMKGKGYEPAERRPEAFHGTGPFELGNGAKRGAASGTTYTEAFGQALVRLAERDERVVAITAAMTQGTGLDEFARRFPQRFYDVGIAEEHAAVFAAGLAIGGRRPVVAVYSTFLQRAYDMLVQDVGLQDLPVIFAIDRAGLVGDDGPTHHGVFDFSYLRPIPNFTVMAPSSQLELQRMLATAFTLDGPVAIRYPRGLAAPFEAPPTLEPLVVGEGQVLQEGAGTALIGIGTGVGIAVAAAAILERQGRTPTVVDARFVKPLDAALLDRLAASHERFVTIEENVLAGGFGSAVLEHVAGRVEVVRFGVPDAFVAHGDRALLLRDVGLTPEAVAAAVAAQPATLTRVK
jgi:1-deoxy-D-xylulose-5-phosphate synthase